MILSSSNMSQHDFFCTNQKYLNWFVFFSVFPLVKIAGISVTFFIFVLLALRFYSRGMKLFYVQQPIEKLLVGFLLMVAIAAVLSEETFRQRSIFSIIKLMTQYVYWVALALFVKTWIYYFDFYKLSRSIFIAAVISTIYYGQFNSFYQIFYPNSYAYAMVTAMPLAYYYVLRRFSISVILLISASFILGVTFSGSRMGVTLIIFELLLLLSLGSVKLKKVSLVAGIIILPIILALFLSMGIKEIKYSAADVLDGVSPKIAHTLRMEENVFERDKSWLIRELMIQKGKKIFKEHPLFGVGPGNFTYYAVQLNIGGVSKWLHGSERRYNRTSSQNSYLMILAENGIFALIFILMVFISIVWKGFYYVKSFQNSAEIYIYIPFLALMLYSVILVATLGSMFWFLLGLAMTLTQRKRHIS